MIDRQVPVRQLSPEVVLAGRLAEDLLAVLVDARTELCLRDVVVVEVEGS